MSDPLSFEKVSIEDAKKVLEDAPAGIELPKAEEQDWRWARSFSPPPALSPATVAWLAALPEDVRPTELPRAYSRIANRLAELWTHRDACDRYFDDLTRDRRGKRTGFPMAVAQEIAVLKKHYAGPVASQAQWENQMYRR
jgi:hypothetical protein